MGDFRKEWRNAKDKHKKDLDMSKVADKQNFGPKLDTYEEKRSAYDKLSPDKQTKAKKDEVIAAAKNAADAGTEYIKALQAVESSSSGAKKQAAHDLLTVLGVNIVRILRNVEKGKF